MKFLSAMAAFLVGLPLLAFTAVHERNAAAMPAPGNPVRAAFVYDWYPQNWSSHGHYPTSQYRPTDGYYSYSSAQILKQMLDMEYGNIHRGIMTWWGQGSTTDSRMSDVLATTHGHNFKWSLYYEPAYTSQEALDSDLSYIYDKYARDTRSYWYHDGKPVLFVYARSVKSCTDAYHWVNANRGRFYLDLQVFSNYRNCAEQPDNWHQYAPASREDHQAGHSFSISPGYWKWTDSAPLLDRSVAAFTRAVRDMVNSGEPFQLITTYNEWNEGTAIESGGAAGCSLASSHWESASGHGQYLDVLHKYP